MYVRRTYKKQRIMDSIVSINPSNPDVNKFKLPDNWVHLVLVHGNSYGAVKMAALYKGFVTRRWFNQHKIKVKNDPYYWFC
jgi:hypothetical protein